MNNLLYLNNDSIILELNNSVDKNSTKKMIAFKHFNNDLDMLDDYLNKNNPSDKRKQKIIKNIKKKPQLEFAF